MADILSTLRELRSLEEKRTRGLPLTPEEEARFASLRGAVSQRAGASAGSTVVAALTPAGPVVKMPGASTPGWPAAQPAEAPFVEADLTDDVDLTVDAPVAPLFDHSAFDQEPFAMTEDPSAVRAQPELPPPAEILPSKPPAPVAPSKPPPAPSLPGPSPSSETRVMSAAELQSWGSVFAPPPAAPAVPNPFAKPSGAAWPQPVAIPPPPPPAPLPDAFPQPAPSAPSTLGSFLDDAPAPWSAAADATESFTAVLPPPPSSPSADFDLSDLEIETAPPPAPASGITGWLSASPDVPAEDLDMPVLAAAWDGERTVVSGPPPLPPETVAAKRGQIASVGYGDLGLPEEPRAAWPTYLAGESRVIVHLLAGLQKRGVLRDADLKGPEIALELADGAQELLAVDALKAVFFMVPIGQPVPAPEGDPLTVTLQDGREIEGRSPDYIPGAPGFFLCPTDQRSRTARIYLYAQAIKGVR